MSERAKCAICTRPIATDADWDLNGEIGHDDEAAAKAGLDELCWEPEDDSCLAQAIELGRPTEYGTAMAHLDSLRDGLRSEIDILHAYIESRPLPGLAKLAGEIAEALEALLDRSENSNSRDQREQE
jgi:hypothetical protein